MKRAWTIYKEVHAQYEQWQFDRGIHDGSFSGALKTAWRVLKARTAEAAKKVAELSSPFAVAIQVMRHNIENLQYKSFRYNARAERAQIEAEITRLLDMGHAAAPAHSITTVR